MLVWLYVCPCLLSLGGSLKPEQRNVVNKSGVVKIRMYSDVRNGELLRRKKSFVKPEVETVFIRAW